MSVWLWRKTWPASVFRSGQDQFRGTLATDGSPRLTYDF
jgi:hypothetical protein